jgi:AraC-like DNA-binding protein
MNQTQSLCYTFLIKGAHAAAKMQGISDATLLEGTGLNREVFIDPYLLITYAQEFRIFRNLITASDSPEIGLLVGNHSNIIGLGAAGRLHFSAPDIRSILTHTHKYRTILQPHLKWTIEHRGNELIHVIEEDTPLGDLRQFMIERFCALLMLHAKELLGPDFHAKRIRFSFPEPSYKDFFSTLFQCPIEFNQAKTEIYTDIEHLDRPLENHDPMVEDALNELCSSLQQKLQSDNDIATKVILTLKDEAGFYPSLEQIADSLKMSSRTLRRHLTEKNTTYQKLLNQARLEVAEEHLKNKGETVQQVAELCGFSDAQNFSQAFKRWTGKTPSEFRASP